MDRYRQDGAKVGLRHKEESDTLRRYLYKFLALVITAVLIGAGLAGAETLEKTGNVQAKAADKKLKLTATKKTLYLGGCTGRKESGKKAKYYSALNVRKLIDGFSTKKYDIVLKSADDGIAATDSSKDKIFATGIGKTKVTVSVYDKNALKDEDIYDTSTKSLLTAKIEIVVKQNASQESFTVEGITDGQVIYEGDSLTISLPGNYTDLRKVTCEDDNVSIKALKDGKSFVATFYDPGEYTVLAYAYQSKKYNGHTAFAEYDITVKEREAEVKQIAVDKLEIIGGPVDEEMLAEDLSVYEITDGAELFYTYISDLRFLDEDKAELTLFKNLESEKKYELVFDGLSFQFTAAPCGLKDLASFEIVEDSIRAGEEIQLTFRYYNRKKIDITKAVADKLDAKVVLKQKDEELTEGYLLGRNIYAVRGGLSIDIEASLSIDADDDGTIDIELDTKKTIVSTEKKGSKFTGNIIYTVKPKSSQYLKVDDQFTNEVPLNDDVVFEALFEMDDGSYKTIKQAGITKLVAGDPKILMIGSETTNGGYSLILNSVGESGVVVYQGETIVGACSITVLPARKPYTLKTQLSKKLLNTNAYVEDYILIKADLSDQYGAPIDDGQYDIIQTETSKKSVGEVKINRISDGRFLIYGYDCPSSTEKRKIGAVITSGSLSEEIGFYIQDIAYDSRKDGYSYSLKIDGPLVIDTAVGLSDEAPKSTFAAVEITDNGYYVGEGIGILFDEQPSVRNGADYYEVEPGENIFGISILYTDEKGNKRYLSDDEPCVMTSYLELELCPYTYMEKLPSGSYELTAYKIKALEDLSQIQICDTVNIRVIDTDPDVEVEQLRQSYGDRPKEGWERTITSFFSFKLNGVDISKYITKVDCVEAPSGSIFVRSVDFMIPNPYYGFFTKTATVERLIIKQ